ncbi:phasin family protein [Sneathiella sp. HT1-7]|uniref:phasin family protein n=1 Tax=Sneathiella sp. HT1-7 TaxID=2887192 RepID=UPI001D14119D|nr:phasin family protein [Sneathiella sp. HT1-7]MCC3304694.1 phasin family protein [Sneathiella sp. HT1-7]
MTKKATTNATVDPAVVTKEIEEMVATGRKSLQEAFINGTEAAEKAFKSNTETFKTNYEKAIAEGKTGFEKAIKSLEGSQFYDKNSSEAFVKASNAAVEKSEKIGAEMIDFGTGQLQEVFNVTKTIAETEDVAKAVEIQTEFARTSMQSYMSEVGKLNSLIAEAAKSVVEPFGAQYAASLDMFSKPA